MPDEPWQQETTDLFLRRKEEFQKKRPMQLAAVLHNLGRYQQMLDEQPIARLISANFIHPEKRGLVALRNAMSRSVPKATGKRYGTTSEMLEDTGTPQEIIDSVKEVECQLVVPLLAGMRVGKGLTQKELAQAIGCSQGRISKLETSRDEDLRLQDLLDYTRALEGSLWITIGAPTLAERIKLHIRALRGLLEELVSLAGEDRTISEGINSFLDDIFFETGRLVESSKKALANGEASRQKPELEIGVIGGADTQLKGNQASGENEASESPSL